MNDIWFPKTCYKMIEAILDNKPYTSNNLKVCIEPYGFNIYLYGVLLASMDTIRNEIYLEATKHNLTTLKYLYSLVEWFELGITVALGKDCTFFIQDEDNISINSIKVNYEN